MAFSSAKLKKMLKLIVLFLTLFHANLGKGVQVNDVDETETSEFPPGPTEPPVEMMKVCKKQYIPLSNPLKNLSVL